MNDTIYAEATAPGKAGVAVVRLSGPSSVQAAETLGASPLTPRRAVLRALRDSTAGHLDQAVVIHFAAGASFTGEDVVEFHLHGSRAVVSAVLAALGRLDGLRPAEAGEFTRRALESGRLDLTEVEALADLIDAETEAQRRQAVTGMTGALRDAAETLRVDLIRAAALLEAAIDFADEDVPEDVGPEVVALMSCASDQLRRLVEGSHVAERIRDGFEVAIVGPPNIGKSTLLNRLAKREAAITSDVAGTTRDVIEVRMDLRGLPVTILDTAGLRDAADPVERIGIARARDRARAADLRVFLGDDPGWSDPELWRDGDIAVRGKSDLGLPDGFSGVSGTTGAGVDELVDRIALVLQGRAATASVATRDRHRIAFQAALAYLDGAHTQVDHGRESFDLAAADLRFACRSLDQIIGRVDVESLLDEIFSSFCIGK